MREKKRQPRDTVIVSVFAPGVNNFPSRLFSAVGALGRIFFDMIPKLLLYMYNVVNRTQLQIQSALKSAVSPGGTPTIAVRIPKFRRRITAHTRDQLYTGGQLQ